MIFLVGALLVVQLIAVILFARFLKLTRDRLTGYELSIHTYEKAAIEIRDSIYDFISPGEDGKPSHLVEFLDGVAAMFASRMVSAAEATLRGSAGGKARADNAAEILANPMAGLMTGKLGKNPILNMILQAVVNKFSKPAEFQPANGNNGNKPKFNI